MPHATASKAVASWGHVTCAGRGTRVVGDPISSELRRPETLRTVARRYGRDRKHPDVRLVNSPTLGRVQGQILGRFGPGLWPRSNYKLIGFWGH